jgi:hypothetical protein
MTHNKIFSHFLIALFVLTFLLGIWRISGYFAYHIPYGYDPGFFRHAIDISLAALPHLPGVQSPNLPYHEPLFGILSTILTFIGFSPDTIIWPMLGFLSVFIGFPLYFLARSLYGREAWLLAASIFWISIIGYQEYWWNYWRNIVGIIFLLISLTLILRKSPLSILTIAALFTIHRPSALYFAVLLVIYLLVVFFTKKQFSKAQTLFLVFWWFLALPLYIGELSVLTSMIVPLSTTIGWVTSSGTFYTSREFFILIFPYFLLLIPAIFYKVEKKEFDIVFLGFLVWLTWSVLRLFFYNRMFVFFDLFVILLASFSIVTIIIHFKKKLGYILVALFFLIQGYLYVNHVQAYSSRHTISREEFDIVSNLDILIPEDATILSTHRYYTPWILGYGQRVTLAPWLLDHQIWDQARWQEFYLTGDDRVRCEMIAEYQSIAPKLYVFVGSQQPSLSLPSSCFRPILSNTTQPILYEVLWP